MKVFVYFNLHKRCFSIKALEGINKGRVIAHKHNVVLYDATFKVSEAGRQRVIREQRKNVHAGVSGTWLNQLHDWRTVELAQMTGQSVMYNPYKYDSFVTTASKHPVKTARTACLGTQYPCVDYVNGKISTKPSIHVLS
jgi:hypothetical protein